jgi:protein-tyrosine-phosphatase
VNKDKKRPEQYRLRTMLEKPSVLFLCTHNSARSQMAEGLLRALAEYQFEVHRAGTDATQVRPLAIRAMDEIGIDISGQESKTLERYLGEPFDYVITVCIGRRATAMRSNSPFQMLFTSYFHNRVLDPVVTTGFTLRL